MTNKQNIAIFLPVHSRIETLDFVFKSLYANFELMNEYNIHLYILDNSINNYVSEYINSKFIVNYSLTIINFKVLINYDKLSPVLFWYTEILNHHLNYDYFLLHGDDDIMEKESLFNRIIEISSNKSHMLISRSIGTYYYEQGYFYAHPLVPQRRFIINQLQPRNLLDFTFIGNFLYKSDPLIIATIKYSIDQLKNITIDIDDNSRFAMLPALICMNSINNNLNIKMTNNIYTIRCTLLKEYINNYSGTEYWNNAYLELVFFINIIKPQYNNIDNINIYRRVCKNNIYKNILFTNIINNKMLIYVYFLLIKSMGLKYMTFELYYFIIYFLKGSFSVIKKYLLRNKILKYNFVQFTFNEVFNAHKHN